MLWVGLWEVGCEKLDLGTLREKPEAENRELGQNTLPSLNQIVKSLK